MSKRTKGGRTKSSPQRGVYLDLRFGLYRDGQGLKLALKIGGFNTFLDKVWVLRKNPQWQGERPIPQGNPELTPTVECPEMLAEMFGTKRVEPEDM